MRTYLARKARPYLLTGHVLLTDRRQRPVSMAEPRAHDGKTGKERSGFIDLQKNKDSMLEDASSQALGALMRWRRLSQPITARYAQQLLRLLRRQTPDREEPDAAIPRGLLYEELCIILAEERGGEPLDRSGSESCPTESEPDRPAAAPIDHAAEARCRALVAVREELGVPVEPFERGWCQRYLGFLRCEMAALELRELHMTPLKYALARCAGSCLDEDQDLPPPLSSGLWLEFGVAEGKSLAAIARRVSRLRTEGDTRVSGGVVYGFDSFEGLPEAWKPGFDQGHFARPHGEPPSFGPEEDACIEVTLGRTPTLVVAWHRA